jgi:hypothetical protein
MKKIQIFIGILLMAIALLTACDDFLSPTIEIFNLTKNPTKVEQKQELEHEEIEQ